MTLPNQEDRQEQASSPTQNQNKSQRTHFLPFPTNTFDRVFISVVCFVAISLLWMRFVEAFIPLFVAAILSAILAVIIIRWG